MRPSAFSLPTAVPILSVQEENYRTKTFVLDAALPAQPGQFVMLWLPRFDEKPLSLVSADPLTVMVTAVGPFTRLLHELCPGDRLWVRGPFGHGFAVPPHHRRIALVGGGYGVAPLLWLARAHSGLTPQITTIIGARTAADVLYAPHFHALTASTPGHNFTITTEDGSLGMHGLAPAALNPMIDAGALDGIYACGPHGLLAALDSLARQHHIAAQLSWEAYMRCAVGICGACEHSGKLLCLDGPVLAGTS